MNTLQDDSHLKLLEIFHYVAAGITVLVGCFPVIHLSIGIGMLLIPIPPGEGQEIPRAIGWLFIVISSLIILTFWIAAFVMFLGGRTLRRRQRYMFCLVVAGISCVFMPYGTTLGVFTILVLMRPSVKQIFGVDELMTAKVVDVAGGDDVGEPEIE